MTTWKQPVSLQALRSLLTDHRPCTSEAVATFRDYQLRCSHVAQLVVALIDRGVPLTRAKVKGVTAIGSLRTSFGNIGQAHCCALCGSDRFLVAQAMDVLRNPTYLSDRDVAWMYEIVNQYKPLFASTQPDPKVTIVDSANDCLVADGNKTAIAGFLHAIEVRDSDFQLPVYYLTAPDLIIRWPL